ncbi:hypothetical protein T4A_9069 [Trichinella pseudospiralis]|uniref:Uncharacterized protein n=1 Tax=Trichinella pseudospiralis TaxID=6337 RepID=A0A0V1EVY2_TRIPS|nr:hypothetical protein T4A_9069 [Trichinella pseudospiralis]KRY88364.1 hypothetical protein T4D_12285 [Trichinella pseudospiralis]
MIFQITQIVAIDQCQMKHLDKAKSFCSQTNSKRLFLSRDHVAHRKPVPGHQCWCHLLEQLLAYFQTKLVQVGKICRPSHLQQPLRVRICQQLQVIRQDGAHDGVGFDRHCRASVAWLSIAHFYERRLLQFSNAKDDALATKFVTFNSCRSIHPQGSRQNRIHSPTPPPTLYIRGSPPVNTDTEELLTVELHFKFTEQKKKNKILPSTSQDVRRRVELTGTYDLKVCSNWQKPI